MKKEVEAVAEEEEKTEETAPEVKAKEEETAAEAEALPEGIPDVDTADFGNTQVPFFHIIFCSFLLPLISCMSIPNL